jgi:hypothetical protein
MTACAKARKKVDDSAPISAAESAAAMGAEPAAEMGGSREKPKVDPMGFATAFCSVALTVALLD